jgi:hypothetical protein
MKETVNKIELQEEFAPFLSPREQERVRQKYEDRPFTDLMADLQSNVGDAVLFVMDKYNPLLNKIYTKFKEFARMKTKKFGDYRTVMDLQEWKNDVFLYLSGAGITQPFYEPFMTRLKGKDDLTLWKHFTLVLGFYLKNYFRKLITNQMKELPKGTVTMERPGVIAQASMAVEPPKKIIKTDLPTENDALQSIFEKYLVLLKIYADNHSRPGKTMYKVVILRVKGKTAYEIADIIGITPSGVWKSLSRAKNKWLKFLNAHKTTGILPKKLEKKVYYETPIKK